MKELKKKVEELKKKGDTGISFFLTAGYPDMDTFMDFVKEIDRNSAADFLEIGIPFSDPLADGPVIQKTSRRAIEQGASFGRIMDAVKKLKREVELPLVLMSYLNPLLAGGLEKGLKAARSAGFSAVIIPDLPAGEYSYAEETVEKAGLGNIFLAAPSSGKRRIKEISAKSLPFLYYVSSYGTTGARSKFEVKLADKLKEVKKLSPVPLYCGFGISTPAQAAGLKESLDGIIIGSALLEKFKDKDFKAPLKFAISINKSLGRL